MLCTVAFRCRASRRPNRALRAARGRRRALDAEVAPRRVLVRLTEDVVVADENVVVYDFYYVEPRGIEPLTSGLPPSPLPAVRQEPPRRVLVQEAKRLSLLQRAAHARNSRPPWSIASSRAFPFASGPQRPLRASTASRQEPPSALGRRSHLRARGLPLAARAGGSAWHPARPRGAVCFPQRFGGSLNLNVRYHVAVARRLVDAAGRPKRGDAGGARHARRVMSRRTSSTRTQLRAKCLAALTVIALGAIAQQSSAAGSSTDGSGTFVEVSAGRAFARFLPLEDATPTPSTSRSVATRARWASATATILAPRASTWADACSTCDCQSAATTVSIIAMTSTAPTTTTSRRSSPRVLRRTGTRGSTWLRGSAVVACLD
jgi:hypothetical protein